MSAKVTEYDNCMMSAINRCDRCNAQAYVEVVMPSGAKLLFCAHDFTEHEEKLKESAKEIHDHRPHLAVQETQPV